MNRLKKTLDAVKDIKAEEAEQIKQALETVEFKAPELVAWEGARTVAKQIISNMEYQLKQLPNDLIVQKGILELAEAKCKALSSTAGSKTP